MLIKNKKIKLISTLVLIIFSFTMFTIPVNAKNTKVIIGGEAFGLKLYCKGVMITNLESFYVGSKKICPAEKSGLIKGDIITNINNKTIKNNETVSKIIKNSQGKKLNLVIDRNNKKINISLKPEKYSNKGYHAGMWIRDSCAGIGTITYYNNDNKTYGALGHGICDVDSGKIMKANNGEILRASITSVTKSENNKIGTLNGYFTNKIVGTINDNNILGIYGKTNSIISKSKEYEVCKNCDIKTGKAFIFLTIKNKTPKKYSIEITEICNKEKSSNKNFIIKITDKRLIEKTGGIVQGMSGSPIVQNDKFIGALTHVFVEDCSQGYGVMAENMINRY